MILLGKTPKINSVITSKVTSHDILISILFIRIIVFSRHNNECPSN